MSQLHHPSVLQLQSQKQRGDSAEVGSFLVPHRVPSSCASAPHACMHWCPARVGEETKGMSIARCAPPPSGRPVAMTSIRLSSWVPTWSMMRSMILVLVVTLAPASLPIQLLARGGLLDCVRSLLGHKLHGGRQKGRQRDGTNGQGKWASKTSKEQLPVEAGREGRFLAAGWIRVRVKACWPEGSPFRAQAKAI